jgi:hypothetical protein
MRTGHPYPRLNSDVYAKYPTTRSKANVRIPAPIVFPNSVIESILPLPYMAGSDLEGAH